MDRYGFGHAPLLRDTSVIGMEARSPPPLTDYSYHLVRFHEAIICLHTPPTLEMANYRNTHYMVSDGRKCLSLRKRKLVLWVQVRTTSIRALKVTGWCNFHYEYMLFIKVLCNMLEIHTEIMCCYRALYVENHT